MPVQQRTACIPSVRYHGNKEPQARFSITGNTVHPHSSVLASVILCKLLDVFNIFSICDMQVRGACSDNIIEKNIYLQL